MNKASPTRSASPIRFSSRRCVHIDPGRDDIIACIERILLGVVQGITLPETRYEKYAKGDDYIRRYVRVVPTIRML